MASEFVEAASEAALKVGELLLAMLPEARTSKEIRTKRNPTDLVTRADRMSEDLIVGLLRERFPDHGIFAEEGTQHPGTDYRWIIDPVDGTTNFAHGVPIFCASLALEIDGEAVLGAVYDPNRRELFTAEAGIGAWLNGQPLATSANATVLESMLVTGFPYHVQESPDEFLRVFGNVIRHARAVRRLGSAAIDMCWVAAGRMEGFWEASLKPWDTRAAALIVDEAGGRVTGMDGAIWDAYKGDVVATNGHIHDELLAVLSRR